MLVSFSYGIDMDTVNVEIFASTFFQTFCLGPLQQIESTGMHVKFDHARTCLLGVDAAKFSSAKIYMFTEGR